MAKPVAGVALTVLLALSSGFCRAAAEMSLSAGKTEIVVAADAPKATVFAAEELRDFLSQAFGGAVPVVRAPTPGMTGVYLGSNVWTKAAGIDTAALARDAFTVKADGRSVFIAGRDDSEVDTREAIFSPRSGVWAQLHEHATLFGVYEFLERFAGVRMYFPGELGTIVPKTDALKVPVGAFTVTPEFRVRNVSAFGDGMYFEGENRTDRLLPARKLNYARQRMQTMLVPCCHGSKGFRLLRRFGDTNPEYFAMKKDGTRWLERKGPFIGHICHSSAAWDVMYEDIVSYAKGEDPSVRGMLSWKEDKPKAKPDWDFTTFRRPWVDVMPQDGFRPCQCPSCKAQYNTNEVQYASELIWGKTAELARKLKKTCPDIRLTQMAYTPYRRVPALDIPDNVDVMVAEGGPWDARSPERLERQRAEIAAWNAKLGRKVWIWTYPGKHGAMDLKDIPCAAPRCWARYYRTMAPYVFGAYAECESDRWLYNALNYYVFGKVCWNSKANVRALLEEHDRLMFGAAAEPMSRFLLEVEKKWVDEVASRMRETSIGPKREPPSAYELFTSVYSPEVLASWRDLFRRAEALVPSGSLESRRIALYRQEFLAPLETAAANYLKGISVETGLGERADDPGVRNLLVNGDFSQTQAGRSKRHFGIYEDGKWRGGWITGEDELAFVSFDKEAPKGLPGSVRFSVPAESPRTITFVDFFKYSGTRLKPNTRYRVSCFVKADRVVVLPAGGGVQLRMTGDGNVFYPDPGLRGTFDWQYQKHEFVTGSTADQNEASLTLYLRNASGTVWFSGVRFDEMGPCGTNPTKGKDK